MKARLMAVPISMALAGTLVSGASAQAKTSNDRIPFEYTETRPIDSLCDFPVDTTSHFEGFDLISLDASGDLMRFSSHVTQTDVFTANGKSLTSRPYTYNLRFVFDDNGNLENLYFSGVLMKVPLGQGQTFLAAGRLDALQSEDEFAVVPDSGTIRNQEAFCAALS